jgi:hypothetical protein
MLLCESSGSIGIIFPAGMFIVDDNALEDQPWRRMGKPRDIQEYFDGLHSDMMSLKIVCAPIAGL